MSILFMCCSRVRDRFFFSNIASSNALLITCITIFFSPFQLLLACFWLPFYACVYVKCSWCTILFICVWVFLCVYKFKKKTKETKSVYVRMSGDECIYRSIIQEKRTSSQQKIDLFNFERFSHCISCTKWNFKQQQKPKIKFERNTPSNEEMKWERRKRNTKIVVMCL